MEYELNNKKEVKRTKIYYLSEMLAKRRSANFLLSKFFTLFCGLEKTFDLCSKQV